MGARNADESSHGSEGIAAMMPCVGDESFGINASSHGGIEAIEPLLTADGEKNYDEGPEIGLVEFLTIEICDDRLSGFEGYQDRDHEQERRHEERGESFELSISIIETAIGVAIRDADEYEHYNIGSDIIEGMESIGEKGF